MISITEEECVCIQSDEPYTCYVIASNGQRFFATEDKEYLLSSIEVFAREDCTIVLTWDRNSLEAEGFGPSMDLATYGDLLVSKRNEIIVFSTRCRDDFTELFSDSALTWSSEIEKLRTKK
jgi:hypothetical protein